jgi:hypothetical protein
MENATRSLGTDAQEACATSPDRFPYAHAFCDVRTSWVLITCAASEKGLVKNRESHCRKLISRTNGTRNYRYPMQT